MSWDDRMYALAVEVAQWSKDPKTKVGAVLTHNRGRALYTGYNGFPSGVPDLPEWLADAERRAQLTVHAEVNAVTHAQRLERSIAGWSLYVTKCPCNGCALLIATTGVGVVHCPPPRSDGRWGASQKLALDTLAVAGTRVVLR